MNPIRYYIYLRRRHGYAPRVAWASVLLHYCADGAEVRSRYVRHRLARAR